MCVYIYIYITQTYIWLSICFWNYSWWNGNQIPMWSRVDPQAAAQAFQDSVTPEERTMNLADAEGAIIGCCEDARGLQAQNYIIPELRSRCRKPTILNWLNRPNVRQCVIWCVISCLSSSLLLSLSLLLLLLSLCVYIYIYMYVYQPGPGPSTIAAILERRLLFEPLLAAGPERRSSSSE